MQLMLQCKTGIEYECLVFDDGTEHVSPKYHRVSFFLSPPPSQDRDGTPRVTGEEWLVKKIGAYLPGAYEEVIDVVDAYILTEKVSDE